MVKLGLGVGGMLTEIADLTTDVERVWPALPKIPVPYWVCTHRELHHESADSSRVCALCGALEERALLDPFR